MKLDSSEPTMAGIEDYDGKESSSKRKTVWIIIISGLVIATIYGFIMANSSQSDRVADQDETGIRKH